MLDSLTKHYRHHSREELIEEIDYLRRELGFVDQDTELARAQAALRLSPQCARIVMALYQAGGKALKAEHLSDLINSESESDNHIRTQIYYIRQKYGPDIIKTVTPGVYAMAEAGRAIVERYIGGE